MSEDKEKSFSETIKKIISTGVGGAFMTDETIRKILSDLPLPKEMITGLIQNAKGVKEDFISGVQEEVRNRLNHVDPKRLVDEILENYDVEMNATFRFKKKKKSSKKKK